jgi:hypothetical protein
MAKEHLLDAKAFSVGQTIRVTNYGHKKGVPFCDSFEALVTFVDERRAEYEGSGHKGGFALPANRFLGHQIIEVNF